MPRAVALYPRPWKGFGMLVFFINSSLAEFHVGYLTLFHLFLVIYGFAWFWMESLPKNINLMLSSSKLHSWPLTCPTIH